ncbi:MAG TPA: penicillin acylase family protein [Acidimicrobiales bacterium]
MTAVGVEVEGVERPVDIVRDGYGVPHCFAATERDAFFAQGWVHAADRLWQMEYDRRRALGRWAEVVGERAIAADSFYRRVALERAVLRDLDALAPETVAMLEAYTAGVNAAIAALPRTSEFVLTGVTPEPWQPWHCMLVYRVRHLLMGSARSKLWRSVVAQTLGADVAKTMVAGWGEDHIASVPPGAPCTGVSGLGDEVGGSNNWVVAGSRTASGAPLLAGDPHRELEAPNVYVQGHVACPEFDVLGFAIPGVPGFSHFGHNERVAWSITHAMPDDQDLYEFGDGVPVSRTETISVRDGDDVTIEVADTRRGPIVGANIALCWTATADVNDGFDVILPMLRARSVDELFDTMRAWVEPVNSLLAADVDGNIGYLTRGRLPRRSRMEGAWLPVPGDDASYAWDGWVAFEDMPRVVNPGNGFLFSANNRIAADPDAPYIGVDAASPWRAHRIFETLTSTENATVADMEALHRDVVSIPASRFATRLAEWAPLGGWDGSMDRESTAAAAYSVARRELLLLVLERSGLGDALDAPHNRLLPGVVPESVLWRVTEQHLSAGDVSLLGGWTWDDALGEAIARAEKVWAGERWGELHTTLTRHPLGHRPFDPPRVEMSGDLDTVQAASYIPTHGFAMRAGSVARYAFDVADWDNSGWVVPLGAAGEPGAPHAADQQRAWADGRLVAASYTRAAVEAEATETTRLTPG